MKVKMKMSDLGVQPPNHKEHVVESKPKVRYPSVRISADKLPEIEDIRHGSKCTLVFEGEVTALKTAEEYDDAPKGTQIVTFDLKKGVAYPEVQKSKPLAGKTAEDAATEAAEEGKDNEALGRVRKKMKDY